ncbi:MAG: N-terminal, partial [Patescibacteria group bacterium]|nr:N-terminal [Patescibacteria group bacterium]
MKMADKRKQDRPREKLVEYGPEKLSDIELLQALIG